MAAPGRRLALGSPARERLGGQPEADTSARLERALIFRPVAEAVRRHAMALLALQEA